MTGSRRTPLQPKRRAVRGAPAGVRPAIRGEKRRRAPAARPPKRPLTRRRRNLRRAAVVFAFAALALGLWALREWRVRAANEAAAGPLLARLDPTKNAEGSLADPGAPSGRVERGADAKQSGLARSVKAAEARKPPPKARPPAPPASQRAILLAAIRARADDLAACERPPGVSPRLPARIRVQHDGKVRAVSFNARGLPAEYADCLRTRITAWSFVDVGLQSDVNVLVDFALDGTPSRGGTTPIRTRSETGS